jgi:hypothetical protein
MRWHVQAEGDAPPGDHRDLAERLGKLLRQGRFGTDASNFSGEDVNGPVHAAAAGPDPEPETGDGGTTAEGEGG